MEPLWQLWRQGFTQWEQATAKLLETALKSPAFLEPSGQALSSLMKGKKQFDDLTASFLTTLGLPIRRDQERMLHLLNQLQSRLIDLEERIEDRLAGLEERLAKTTAAAAASTQMRGASLETGAEGDV
jgi:hypothetical protein